MDTNSWKLFSKDVESGKKVLILARQWYPVYPFFMIRPDLKITVGGYNNSTCTHKVFGKNGFEKPLVVNGKNTPHYPH